MVGFALAGIALAAVAVVGLFVVLPWAYGTYGFHPEQSARSWAALAPQYAVSGSCATCHAAEYEPWAGNEHAVVACGTCHGALAEHAATAPAEGPLPEGAAPVEAPPYTLCALCHEASPARPEQIAVVTLAGHYGGAPCLGCHEPHRVEAKAPPLISHPLEGLPGCITCHTPDGLKPVPVGHEPANDAVCRTCHLLPPAGRSDE